jgi:hypothetical protein
LDDELLNELEDELVDGLPSVTNWSDGSSTLPPGEYTCVQFV